MKFDFVVIGATGEQGRIAARDLLETGFSVLLCGRNPDKIQKLLKNKRAKFAHMDLNDIGKTAAIIRDSKSSIVLNCAELAWNIHAMKACLKAGVHYLDLGGLQEMTHKQFTFSVAFRKKGLVALLGCGSTPGISNVMAAYAINDLDTVDHIDLGFAWDSNIKKFVLPYSYESIMHELTVPAVVLEKGRFEKTTACVVEGITHFFEIGRQTTYCIVHSEVYTFYRYFKAKGLQSIHYKAGFPEHSYQVLSTLMEFGFGSKEPIEIKGEKTTPLDVTSRILRDVSRPKGYSEIEDVWVKVSGMANGKIKNIAMDCVVKPTPGWNEAGSNVDTGRTISVIAQMLKRAQIKASGVTAPEACVPPIPFFKELQKRGMKIYRNGKQLRL